LLQNAALSALSEPTRYSLRILREWLEGEGNHFGNLALKGEDSKTWGSSSQPQSQANDLIAIKPEVPSDKISQWIVEHLVIWIHHYILNGRSSKPDDLESGPLAVYDDEIVLRCTSYATTIIACSLPIVSTTVLYFLQNQNTRVGLAAVFTLIFVVCLVVFTQARRVEIFAAAAA
jgi:hypothetical protein